jgi:cytochrome c oxidase cbb3-type subunit 3/ubiquinol-cytochrome c reductase cytochrome c subunit
MRHTSLQLLLLSAACVAATGCNHFPGKPGPEPEVPRPEHVLDFNTLYSQNCAACHGTGGKGGAAISLANPVYLATVSENDLTSTITKGVPGKLMPSFGNSAGGLLTDEQVKVLVHGIEGWKDPSALGGATPPPYHATGTASVADGEKVFAASCARCHGDDGQGKKTGSPDKRPMPGSIVDPAYLALVSDQYLRTIVIAGIPEMGMPDWRGPGRAKPLSNDEVTSVVAWLGSHRRATTEKQQQPQPEETHPTGPKKSETLQEPR